MLVAEEEIARRRAELDAAGGWKSPESQTPWQEIQRSLVDQFDKGGVLKPAVAYQRVAQTKGAPRDNH
jgi:dihydroxy-acid dehydratase